MNKTVKLFFTGTALFTANLLYAQNTILLQVDKGKDTINKNIYGHFAEHLGHCIYGGLYVGDNNKKIPNKNGIRLDVIEALKKLKIPALRWPGGCRACPRLCPKAAAPVRESRLLTPGSGDASPQ